MFEEISKSQKPEVIQAKRKVVYTKDHTIDNSILWDDRKGRYYTRMKLVDNSEGFYDNTTGELREKGFDLDKPLNDSEEFYDKATGNPKADAPKKWIYDGKKYVQASNDKDRVGLNEVFLEFKDSHFVKANDSAKKVYDKGDELPEAPKETLAEETGEEQAEKVEPYTIRLYAEGKMDHALELAEGFGNGLKAEMLEQSEGEALFPYKEMAKRNIAIKATEYRRLTNVKKDYGVQSLSVESKNKNVKNLEASFGGKTGDMTRRVFDNPQKNLRKYDLIQATFFWLQEKDEETKEQNKKKIGELLSTIGKDIEKVRNSILYNIYDNTIIKGQLLDWLSYLMGDFQTLENHKEEVPKMIECKNNISEYLTEMEKLYQMDHFTILSLHLSELNDALTNHNQRNWGAIREQKSYDAMISFVKNQLGKLKPNGQIRIVVANIPPYKNIQDELGKDTEITDKAEIRSILLSTKYSEALGERLNSKGFVHTQTFNNKEVVGSPENRIKNDLIITIRKKPEDASSPSQNAPT